MLFHVQVITEEFDLYLFIYSFIWYIFAGPSRLTRLTRLPLTKRFPAVVLEIWLPAKSDVWFDNLLKQQHVCLYVTWD